MTVPEGYAFALPDGFSDVEAAPLLCAGAVGYRALRLTGLRDGDALGLTGFGGSAHLVAPGLHRMNPDGSQVEPLTRSPVSEFCPSVLDDGRVLYHRWEYIDKGARVGNTIWSMNPDGTNQRAYYGSGSFWPNSIFYARPVPGHPTMVAGTVTGPRTIAGSMAQAGQSACDVIKYLGGAS